MNKLFLWIAAASAFVLQSCENTDGIRDEIGSLRDRVIALEAKIGSVNTSIVALHKLMDESTIIVGIEPNAKGYEIELSDGTRLPVILGEKIEALVPVMGIDAEGYWTVSLDGGATSERLKVGGEYVSAWPVSGGDHKPGAEGVTPQLKVSADGEWLVSLDGGATYAPLLQNGQPVNALGDKVVVSYSSAFKSVTYDATTGLLAVELLDGEKLTLPVFDDFGLTVTASDNETFRLGETRAFEVVQNNVAEAVIDAPAGWTAVLGETTLTVKAPATFDAASQQAAVSVTVYSDRKYRKLVTLNVTLLDEQVDANAALAWRNFKAGTADNVLLDYSYAGYKHGEEVPADVWGLGYKVYNVVDYGADPTGVRSSRGALTALLKELKLSGRSDAGANLANANARAVIYFPEGRFVLHNDDDNVVDPTSANQKYTDSKGNNRSEEIFIRGGVFRAQGRGPRQDDARHGHAQPAEQLGADVVVAHDDQYQAQFGTFGPHDGDGRRRTRHVLGGGGFGGRHREGRLGVPFAFEQRPDAGGAGAGAAPGRGKHDRYSDHYGRGLSPGGFRKRQPRDLRRTDHVRRGGQMGLENPQIPPL